MRFAPVYSLILACSVFAGPVLAQDQPPAAPVGVLAPTMPAPGWGDWLRDAGVGTAVSGALWGAALLDGGRGPISGLGMAGQLALVGAAGTLPPGAVVMLAPAGFQVDEYMATLSGGLVGLGLGYMLTAGLGGSNPTSLDLGFKAAAMALGQGLGGATSRHLYLQYRPQATDLDRLPENRTDDPIDNWNIRRERQNP